MNPLDLDAIRRLHRNVGPNHQAFVNGSAEDASRGGHGRDIYCQYSAYSAGEPPLNSGAEGLSHPNFYSNESEDPEDLEDPEGEPFEMEMEEDEEDAELQRKRKELQEIEEQIIRKKVAIALKKVEPFVKEATSPDFSCSNEQSVTSGSASLKKRVNAILQQQQSASFLSNLRCRTNRMNSSGPCKGGLVPEDHPLKLRVKALMKQRCNDPCLLSTHREVPDVSPPPPSRRATSPASEASNQGFQLFLSVLNKGVDMDLLSRIVTDDSEDLPHGAELLNIQPPAEENKSDLPVRSRRSNSGASLLGHSGTDSRERKTDPPSQDRPLSDRLSQHEDNEEEEKKKSGRGDLHLASSSRSRSPLPVRKKKEIEKPKVDEQHAQLQNILNSLGLSLEAEEMSKLADRTQERLYGKKLDGASTDSRAMPATRERGSHRQRRSSSSSSTSSSSTPSGSASRGISPSPPRHHHHPTRRKSERSILNNNSGGGPTCGDANQDDKAAQTVLDRENSAESGVYQQPYPQNQMYPDPHAADLSAFPDYSLSQYAQYDTYHGGIYDVATHSSWTYTEDDVPFSLYPSGYPYPQNSYHHFPDSISAPNTVYSRHKPFEDINLLINPDLSKSEGQTGSTSGPRCLQVISTKPAAPQSCLKQITKCGIKRKGNPETWKKRQRLRKKQKKDAKWKAKEVLKANHTNDPIPTAAPSDEKQPQTDEKLPQTEEQIKANLRKKLEAFNRKAKQKAETSRQLSDFSHVSQFADCHESLI